MPVYKYEFDPVKKLEENRFIPKSLIDLPQVIAEKQAKKLLGRSIVIDSEDKNILEFLQKLMNKNRIHEQAIMIEELCSLFGQVILCWDKYPGEDVPFLSFADPYMLSRVGKFHVEEKVASVYKYIVRDSKSYPVYEEWTDKKVKRIWYLPSQDIQVDSMKADIPDLKSLTIDKIEEKNHNLGCLPVTEMRNKSESMSLWVLTAENLS